MVQGAPMKILAGTAVLLLLAGPTLAQTPPAPADPSAGQAAAMSPAAGTSTATKAPSADAYYYFSLGHLQELQYETTGKAEFATQAVESYKKALALDPSSPVIIERLAETNAKSQHIHDAVTQAEQALKEDPDNINAHRLLARIYVRTLGDLNAGQVQQSSLSKAVAQFEEILKLDPTDDDSALWLSRLYRFQNEHAKSEEVLRGVLQREPDNEAALEQLSQLLLDEGQPQQAVDLLSGAASGSDSPGLYDLLGNAYALTQQNDKAEETYRKAVELDPDDPGHHRGLAQALIAQDKLKDALEQYQRLTELEPESPESYLRMAQIYRRMGKVDDAQKSLARAKELSPDSIEVLYNQALLYETQGKFTQAVQVITDAIASVRSSSSGGADAEPSPNALGILYEQLGRIYREQSNYDAALKAYDDMSHVGPENAKRAQLLRLDTLRDSRDIDRAIQEAQKDVAASPKDQSLIVSYSMLLAEKGRIDEAQKDLQNLLQNDNDDQEIYLDLAQIQERGRRYADAEASAAKAEETAQRPDDKASAWFQLGAIYEREKKYDQAEQQFKKVLGQNPNNAAALNYYGYMLADRGVRLDEAVSLIQHAVDQDPINGAYLDSLGWVYFKQGKLTEAQEFLSKAVDRMGHDPTILQHLADVDLKLGQTRRAVELYENALTEWTHVLPADYEADRVADAQQQLKSLKLQLAEKHQPNQARPQ
jgi:tetratricopeptide (TPR) repeat protein